MRVSVPTPPREVLEELDAVRGWVSPFAEAYSTSCSMKGDTRVDYPPVCLGTAILLYVNCVTNKNRSFS